MRRANLLTDDEMSVWKPNLMSWTLIMRDLDHQLRQDSGMPHAYFATLMVLADSPRREGIPLTDLAELLDYSQSRMSHAISKMIDSGWIESSTGEDRRIRNIRLTRAGFEAYKDALVGHLDQVRKSFFAHLTERELQDLRRIGEKLLQGLTNDHGRPEM